MADNVVIGDMFWDDYDPEKCDSDPDEILHDNYSPGEIARLNQATRHPDFYGFYLDRGDGEIETDNEYHYFSTKEAAESELARLKFESRPVEGGND